MVAHEETAIPLGRLLPDASRDRPGRRCGNASAGDCSPACRPLFGLAPGGVCPATSVTRGAVRSYRTFSPLLAFALSGFVAAGLFRACRAVAALAAKAGGSISVALSLRSPSPDVIRHRASVEPGLSSIGFHQQQPSSRLTQATIFVAPSPRKRGRQIGSASFVQAPISP